MRSATSTSLDAALPPLDLHAHVDPTVTPAQLLTLGPAIVFAVTRTLDEAAQAAHRNDDRILWGVGAHPGRGDALDGFSAPVMAELVARLDFVGEVGLDRLERHPRALEVLHASLASAREHRKLCSVHSTGRHREVLEAVAADGRGVVLHWFTGTARQVQEAAAAGCYFSINAAMTDTQLTNLPPERLLPETDYPFTRKAGSKSPGDIEVLERRCAQLLGKPHEEVRHMWYRNLRTAVLAAGSSLTDVPAVLQRPLVVA